MSSLHLQASFYVEACSSWRITKKEHKSQPVDPWANIETNPLTDIKIENSLKVLKRKYWK